MPTQNCIFCGAEFSKKDMLYVCDHCADIVARVVRRDEKMRRKIVRNLLEDDKFIESIATRIFGLDVNAVRFLFLASPIFYPAIRFIQAFIAMLITVPLMRTLSGTPWLWKKENILSSNQTV